jgi:hypothetical protein
MVLFVNILMMITLLTSCVVAWKWGGLDERLAAGAILLAVLASNLTVESRFHGTESGVFIVDAVLLIGLLVIALRSDRYWPMWATAFQLVATMVHLGSMVETGDFAWAYYVALAFWSFPVFLTVIAGTWIEGRYRRA